MYIYIITYLLMLLPYREKLTFATVAWSTACNSTIYLKILKALFMRSERYSGNLFEFLFFYNLPDNGKAETIIAISDTI